MTRFNVNLKECGSDKSIGEAAFSSLSGRNANGTFPGRLFGNK